MWNERTNKAMQRDYFFQSTPQSKSYLTLAGEDCADIRAGLQRGVISRETKITVVEHDPSVVQHIKKWFGSHWRGAAPTICCTGLHRLQTKAKFDLLFLDLNGNLNVEELEWMRRDLVDLMLPDAKIGLTIAKSYRNNRLIPAVMGHLKSLYPDVFRRMCVRQRNLGVMQRCLKECIAMYEVLLRYYVFPQFDFDFSHFAYGEFTSPHHMVLFVLESFRPKTQTMEDTRIVASLTRSFQTLIDQHKTQTLYHRSERLETMKSPKASFKSVLSARQASLSSRATKAWKTRREQESGTRTSRKLNLTPAQLSQRAKKAWKTRRRSGWVHPAKRRQTTISA